jgi:hypothetical protein
LAIEKETTKTLLEKLRAAEKVTHEAHQRIRTLQQELTSQRLLHEKARLEWMSTTATVPGSHHSPLSPSRTKSTHTSPPKTTNNMTLESSVSNMTGVAPPGGRIIPHVGSSGNGDNQSIESLLTLSPLDLHWPPPPPPTKTMTLTTSSPTSVVSAAATPTMTSATDPFAWFPTNKDNWAGSSNSSLNGSFSSLTMIHQPTNNNINNNSETNHNHHAPQGLGVVQNASCDTENASVMDSLYFLSSPRDVFHVLSGPPGLPRLFPLDDTVVDDDVQQHQQ